MIVDLFHVRSVTRSCFLQYERATSGAQVSKNAQETGVKDSLTFYHDINSRSGEALCFEFFDLADVKPATSGRLGVNVDVMIC